MKTILQTFIKDIIPLETKRDRIVEENKSSGGNLL